jgi:dolichyl-phosphate-mannose-protein mannosyltransferase
MKHRLKKTRKALSDLRQPLPLEASGMTRREVALLAFVFAVGVVVRLLALSRSAVEHFDEGVYASNIYFPAPAYAYPQQRFYAPPLLPALIEVGMIIGLPPNLAALLPSFLAGCGTIVAVWWFGRSWFGPAAGLAAATLVALSDFHVLLSTAALTDGLLGLWLVLAVDAMARSLHQGDYRWAVGAGIYTGLAWWTKYNGWLPLAIEAAALPVLWFVLRPQARQLRAWIGCFAVTAVTAGLIWSPYFFSLQAAGGYAPIAENHAKYVVGLAGWIDSAGRQISNQYVIERLLSPFSVGLALLIPSLLQGHGSWSRVWRGGALFTLVVLAFFWSSFVALLVAGALGLARIALKRRTTSSKGQLPERTIALALMAVWFTSLLFVTPLYAPYARLTLPLIIAAAIAAALNVAEPLADWELPKIARWPKKWQYVAIASLLGSLFVVPWLFFPQDFDFGRPPERRDVQRIAKLIRDEAGPVRVIFVFGEPAMLFQLRAAGEEFVVPVESAPTRPAQIDERVVPTFLLAGPHARRDSKFNEQIKSSNRWKLVEQWEYQPSALVWLDLHDPRQPADSKESFQLFEFIR